MSRGFIHLNACAPMALSQLFGKSFEQLCDDIAQAKAAGIRVIEAVDNSDLVGS